MTSQGGNKKKLWIEICCGTCNRTKPMVKPTPKCKYCSRKKAATKGTDWCFGWRPRKKIVELIGKKKSPTSNKKIEE